MTVKTRGIVLGQVPLREPDRKLILLTADLGLIEVVARGVGGKKSKLSASAEVLAYSEFCLFEGRSGYIADSADPLRRARGRRGLDILEKLQKLEGVTVRVTDENPADATEADVKLLKLAQAAHGAVMTGDFNLAKVAAVAGVKVLNLNDLTQALRPPLLPGEAMRALIVKEGKEPGQGVAYLDDGTMLVVENGRAHIDETVDVVVTSVLQTSAGRMIFAKVKE